MPADLRSRLFSPSADACQAVRRLSVLRRGLVLAHLRGYPGDMRACDFPVSAARTRDASVGDRCRRNAAPLEIMAEERGGPTRAA
jgi:hypothetical protein